MVHSLLVSFQGFDFVRDNCEMDPLERQWANLHISDPSPSGSPSQSPRKVGPAVPPKPHKKPTPLVSIIHECFHISWETLLIVFMLINSYNIPG